MGHVHTLRKAIVHCLTTTFLASALVVGIGAWPAHAAPPSNDEWTSARVVTQLPYLDVASTTEATPGDGDTCGPASVWYVFTPSVDGVYEFDVRLSDFVASLAIFEGPPPGNPPLAIDCEATSAFVRVPLDAGTTYYIESANPLGEPPTGDLWFRVTQDPNPLQIDVTLDRTGRVGSTAGTAVVSGTATCNKEEWIDIRGQVQQKQGKAVASGSFGQNFLCSPVTRTWTGTARAFTRVYLPGDADVSVTASLCEEFFCTSDTEHKTVRLRR